MMIMLNLKKNSILFGQETQSKSVSGDAMQIHDFVKKKVHSKEIAPVW